MDHRRAGDWSRRDFVSGLTLAEAAGLLGVRPESVAAEPPPETTRLRLVESQAICFAPQYVAGEQLLQAEGFTDVQYVKKRQAQDALRSGEADLTSTDAAAFVSLVDRDVPIVALTGLHAGCYELFGTDRIRSIGDLRG
ncbi:MAG: hypothetical protein ACRELA_02470 [Candidatus Rokuibacteriota bacterium]